MSKRSSSPDTLSATAREQRQVGGRVDVARALGAETDDGGELGAAAHRHEHRGAQRLECGALVARQRPCAASSDRTSSGAVRVAQGGDQRRPSADNVGGPSGSRRARAKTGAKRVAERRVDHAGLRAHQRVEALADQREELRRGHRRPRGPAAAPRRRRATRGARGRARARCAVGESDGPGTMLAATPTESRGCTTRGSRSAALLTARASCGTANSAAASRRTDRTE